MFHKPHDETDKRFDPVVEFERHALHVAIEVARAEGFTGTEAALTELLRALEKSQGYPDF